MNEERTLQMLRRLAENDRGRGASPDLGVRLREEFREHQIKRARGRRALWLGASAVAAGVIIAAMLVPRRIPAAAIKPSQAGPPASTISTNERSLTPSLASKNKRPLRAMHAASGSSPARAAKVVSSVVQASTKTVPPKAARAPEAEAAETVTDFFPLLEPEPPFERGEILRVNLPASVMRTVGLPVREERLGERVQADILVGEEGLPRAIRFVRTGMQ